MEEYIEKYKIKDEGLKLEAQDPQKAIVFYNNLLNHEYFINDFWSYRRLVLIYEKISELDKEADIIKKFFKSEIYCNNHQFLWFRLKLKILSDKGFITNDEIRDLEDYFKKHSIPNKHKSNTLVLIADRIHKYRARIIVVDSEKYEKKQKQYEYEVRCSELNWQKRYVEYIELLNHMIDDLAYKRSVYFKKLCVAYRRINDSDNELRVIERYLGGEVRRSKTADKWFEKRLKEVKNSDYKKEYIIPFRKDEINLEKTPIYEYNKSLDEFENLKRKNILIQHGIALTQNNMYNEAIMFYKYLCNNTYFSNDWYPYRQLTLIYEKIGDYNANLVNIKRLLHSKIYLNNYQFIWFSEKLRQIIKKENIDEYQIQEWIDYYESHGALNKNKANKFLADKFKNKSGKIIVISDESFNHQQEKFALLEAGSIYENVGNWELAITHYLNIINQKEFNYTEFYQRTCICLEKLKDYNRELKVIKLYCTTPPIDVMDYNDEWFEKRLIKVNGELTTDYTLDNMGD